MKVDRKASDLKLHLVGKRLFHKQSRYANREEGFETQRIRRPSLLEGEVLPSGQKMETLEEEATGQGLYTVIEDPRVTRYTHHKLQLADKQLLLVSGLLLFLGMMKVETDRFYPHDKKVAASFLLLMSVITLALILLLVLRKILILQLEIEQKKIYLQKDCRHNGSSVFLLLLRKWELVGQLMLEVGLVLPHPNLLTHQVYYSYFYEEYSMNLVYSVNDLLGVLMIVKIYVVLRSLVALTIFASPRASRLCNHNGLQHDLFFSVKCLQQEYPLKCIFLMFLLCMAIFGYGFRITEGNLSRYNPINLNGFQSYSNCYWYTFITMATIGYGDYIPDAIIARMLAVALAIIGVVLNSLLVVSLGQYLKMKMNELRSHTTLFRLSRQKELRIIASGAVSETIQIAQMLSNNSLDPLVRRKLGPRFLQLKKTIDIVKNEHRKIKSIITSQNITEEMMKSFELMKDLLKEIYQNQRKLKHQIEYMEEKTECKSNQVRMSFLNEVSNIMQRRPHSFKK